MCTHTRQIQVLHQIGTHHMEQITVSDKNQNQNLIKMNNVFLAAPGGYQYPPPQQMYDMSQQTPYVVPTQTKGKY